MRAINVCYRRALFLAFLTFLWACGGGNTTKSEEGGSSEMESTSEITEEEAQVVEQIDRVIHDLPPPSDIPMTLSKIGAEFKSDYTHDISRVDSYETNVTAALNLGIYATDAGYYLSYDQVQDALQYVEGCQTLADKLGIGKSFDFEFIKRFEGNLGNRDSLAVLLNEAMENSEVELENANRAPTAALALVGSYVEGLHIAMQVLENYPKDLPSEERNVTLEPLLLLVHNMQPALLDLIGVLNSIERDELVEEIYAEMGVLRFNFDEIGNLEDRIREDPAHEVIDEGVLKNMTEEVDRIRNDIINGS